MTKASPLYPRVAHLAPYSVGPYTKHYLYAARFDNGMVKIGATKNPLARAYTLQDGGRRLIAEFVVAPLGICSNWFELESFALMRARHICEPCNGREMFRDLPYEEAIRIIKAVAHSASLLKPTPETAKA